MSMDPWACDPTVEDEWTEPEPQWWDLYCPKCGEGNKWVGPGLTRWLESHHIKTTGHVMTRTPSSDIVSNIHLTEGQGS